MSTSSPNPALSAEPTATTGPSPGVSRWGWRAYGATVVVTALIGLVFAASMHPTAGPYKIDERYPFGDAERSYQVTVGFDWIAYAILLVVAGSAVRRVGGRTLWGLLALSLVILWFPHVLIGAAMVLHGS